MKEVNLTMEEWQRLAATTPQERKRALGQLKRWVTYEIIRRKFSLEYGPFSCAAMGGYAVNVIYLPSLGDTRRMAILLRF